MAAAAGYGVTLDRVYAAVDNSVHWNARLLHGKKKTDHQTPNFTKRGMSLAIIQHSSVAVQRIGYAPDVILQQQLDESTLHCAGPAQHDSTASPVVLQ